MVRGFFQKAAELLHTEPGLERRIEHVFIRPMQKNPPVLPYDGLAKRIILLVVHRNLDDHELERQSGYSENGDGQYRGLHAGPHLEDGGNAPDSVPPARLRFLGRAPNRKQELIPDYHGNYRI